jgi:hypothetical protein
MKYIPETRHIFCCASDLGTRIIQGFQNKPAEFHWLLELLPPATFRLVTGKKLYTKVQANQHDVCYVPIGIRVGLEFP